MKKAWEDIKSFVTVALTIAFIAAVFKGLVDGKSLETIFSIVIAFYFGTQYQKKVSDGSVTNSKENNESK